jgi:hypothetical protein
MTVATVLGTTAVLAAPRCYPDSRRIIEIEND